MGFLLPKHPFTNCIKVSNLESDPFCQCNILDFLSLSTFSQTQVLLGDKTQSILCVKNMLCVKITDTRKIHLVYPQKGRVRASIEYYRDDLWIRMTVNHLAHPIIRNNEAL